jgi:hypothetical protein
MQSMTSHWSPPGWGERLFLLHSSMINLIIDNTNEGTEEVNEIRVMHQSDLRIWSISLLPQTESVEFKELMSTPISHLPSRVNLAGDYVLLVNKSYEEHENNLSDLVIGRIHLFNWKSGEFAELPKVCPYLSK